MDENVFVTRVAPLLDAGDLVALRVVARGWRVLVDCLLPYKSAFVGFRVTTVQAARFLMSHGRVGVSMHRTDPRFSSAAEVCLNSSLEDAQWLSHKLATSHGKEKLLSLTARVDVAQWLCEGVPRALCVDAFRRGLLVISNMPLPVLQFLADHVNITKQELLFMNKVVLRSTCEAGALDVLQWLVHRFQLTRQDFVGPNSAFAASCREDQVDTARWIVEHFHFQCAEVLPRALFFELIWNKRWPIATWLVEYFKDTDSSGLFHRSHILEVVDQYASLGGFDAIDWLCATFQITDIDLARALRAAYFRNTASITLPLGTSDFWDPQASLSDSDLLTSAVFLACEKAFADLALYLARKFRLQRDQILRYPGREAVWDPANIVFRNWLRDEFGIEAEHLPSVYDRAQLAVAQQQQQQQQGEGEQGADGMDRVALEPGL
jgi:hypothetical protein